LIGKGATSHTSMNDSPVPEGGLVRPVPVAAAVPPVATANGIEVRVETTGFEADDGLVLFCYRWLPADTPRAVIHIAHGLGEHARRYDWTARQLVDAGYGVIANDHRGHGKTADVLGRFGDDGWNRIIADVHELISDHREEFPGLPVVLCGHSMGAMLAERYIELHGDTVDAVILSGSPGFVRSWQGLALRLLTWFERWRLGPTGESRLLEDVLFGSSNKAFASTYSARSGFEWLSRDLDQVRAYVNDPACGFVPCCGSLRDLFQGAAETQRSSAVRRIPTDLPILLLSGTEDPVHKKMANLDRLLAAYRNHGLHVDTRFYEGARHEVLNEINREAVIRDIVAWIQGQLTETPEGGVRQA